MYITYDNNCPSSHIYTYGYIYTYVYIYMRRAVRFVAAIRQVDAASMAFQGKRTEGPKAHQPRCAVASDEERKAAKMGSICTM